MPDPGPKRDDRRDSPRVIANFECVCSGFHRKGSGVLVDISESGALLEDTTFVPVRGELIGLCLELPTDVATLMIGWVTRHTETGFAIEFDESTPEAQRMAREIAALIRVRPRPDRSGGR